MMGNTYYKIKKYKKYFKYFLLFIIFFIIFIDSDFFQRNFDKNFFNKNNKIENKKNNSADFKKEKTYSIVRVVDGDTIIANINNFNQRIRIIGLNTPESHQVNGRVVECFGKEASSKAKEIFKKHKKIFIETDQSQDKYDKHGRLLAHIFYEENGQKVNFAKKMIEDGYAYEFTYRLPYKYQKEYKDAQRNARWKKLGLWNKKTCNGKKSF